MSEYMNLMSELGTIDLELWALEERYTRAFILVPSGLVALRNRIEGHRTVNSVLNRTVLCEYWEKLEGLKRRFDGETMASNIG